jgi:hypothetical protein
MTKFKTLAKGENNMQDPLRGLGPDDLKDLPNEKVVFERLTTPQLEAIFFPKNGRLILLFPDGQRRQLEHNTVKALTSFLDQHMEEHLNQSASEPTP